MKKGMISLGAWGRLEHSETLLSFLFRPHLVSSGRPESRDPQDDRPTTWLALSWLGFAALSYSWSLSLNLHEYLLAYS